jgi:bisphosphoglycerate-dependent phosphoglycerate mutase
VITSLPGLSESDEYILVGRARVYWKSHIMGAFKDGHNVIIVDNVSNSFRSVLDRLLTLKKTYFQVDFSRAISSILRG